MTRLRQGYGGQGLAPQIVASDPGRSAFVTANAGSGKTWTLACRQPVVSDEDHNEEHWEQDVDAVLDFALKRAYSLGCTPVKGAVRSNDFAARPTRRPWW